MKVIIVIDGAKDASYSQFKAHIWSLCQEMAGHPATEQLKVVLTDLKPPVLSVIPFSSDKVAIISIYTSSRVPAEWLDLQNMRGIYQVTEALPVAYSKDWPDEQPTPGVNLLTLFRKKQQLDYPEFIDRWHNGHTPLSLEIHPLWNYNRNVVEKSLLDVSKWYDGIVEEQVRDTTQLLNPFKFFGGALQMVPNMIKVYLDVKGFIDYPSIETFLANEYWIKSS